VIRLGFCRNLAMQLAAKAKQRQPKPARLVELAAFPLRQRHAMHAQAIRHLGLRQAPSAAKICGLATHLLTLASIGRSLALKKNSASLIFPIAICVALGYIHHIKSEQPRRPEMTKTIFFSPDGSELFAWIGADYATADELVKTNGFTPATNKSTAADMDPEEAAIIRSKIGGDFVQYLYGPASRPVRAAQKMVDGGKAEWLSL
jgi:hypothetical protein